MLQYTSCHLKLHAYQSGANIENTPFFTIKWVKWQPRTVSNSIYIYNHKYVNNFINFIKPLEFLVWSNSGVCGLGDSGDLVCWCVRIAWKKPCRLNLTYTHELDEIQRYIGIVYIIIIINSISSCSLYYSGRPDSYVF